MATYTLRRMFPLAAAAAARALNIIRARHLLSRLSAGLGPVNLRCRYIASGADTNLPSSSQHPQQQQPFVDKEGFVQVFKFPYIAHCAVVCRLKIYQTCLSVFGILPYFVYQHEVAQAVDEELVRSNRLKIIL